MENILLPSRVSIEAGQNDCEAQLIVEPCFHGYGTTLGNALRRVLLSSLVGAAITSVKIKGFTHEFQAIPNVKEDVLQVILNLKQVRVRVHTDEPVKIELHVKGKKIVTAGDIQANADVEIVNPGLELLTLTDDAASIDMELMVERGRGFSPTEERDTTSHDLGTIAIDALFSPVRNVSYRVDETRVGEITDYDKLILSIETDGTITPKKAVEEATNILKNYLSIITQQIGGQEPEAVEA